MNMKKVFAVMLVLAALLMTMPFAASATEDEEQVVYEPLLIATEPGAMSEEVEFLKDGNEEPQPPEAMTWVEGGVHGKALSLNGTTEYFRIDGDQLNIGQMTFSAWINFRGATVSGGEQSAYGQRLFTIGDEECYLTVSPHVVNPENKKEDGYLNGIYLKYSRVNEEGDKVIPSFTGAVEDRNHFGLPQNEWHHMAVVADGQTLRLYVDGNVIFEESFPEPISHMHADVMYIGKWLNADYPFLNALLDDAMLFDEALSQVQIAALMQTGSVEALKNPTAFTKPQSVYLPTTTTTIATTMTTTVPTAQPLDKPDTPFGLPMWGFGVCVAVLAFFVLLTVVVNAYELSLRKANRVVVEEDEEPVQERFLTEKEMKKEKEEQNKGGADE